VRIGAVAMLSVALALTMSNSFANDDYQYFFKSPANGLSVEDQKRIYELLDIQRDPVTQKFTQSECPPAEFDIVLKDLNHDGVVEVLVHGGNTCTAGNKARRFWMFIKSAKPTDSYQLNFGMPVGEYELLGTYNQGYPDIKLQGPGFCFPVWRWNGAYYDHFKNVETAKNGCAYQE
jgi:hypothetical protein